VFGQFGKVGLISNGYTEFTARLIPASGPAVDTLFYTGSATGRLAIRQGAPAQGTENGVTFSLLTGITGRYNSFGAVRATLTGCPVATNEGVWDDGNSLLVRKGMDLGGGLTVDRIIRYRGHYLNASSLALVQVSGTGVTAANNQALILRRVDGVFTVLMRTGHTAPGIGLNKVTVAALLAIDVDPQNGHYAIVGSLAGASSTANQALWSGQFTLGNDTTLQHLRLPKLRLLKGDIYHTEATPGDRIRSIALNPAVDATGVGSRGLRQTVNGNGQIVVTITGDRKVQELVRLTP
jgi:hypothetical protein